MWDNLIHTDLCRKTKLMYGINDSVQTTLCCNIPILVFNVHLLFKFFSPFERTLLSSIFQLNMKERFRKLRYLSTFKFLSYDWVGYGIRLYLVHFEDVINYTIIQHS